MSDTLDFTPDLYTLVDEDGKEQTFEMLDALEVDDTTYYALVPYYQEAQEIAEDDGELVILKAQQDGEEEILVSIDDDEEFDKIGKIFMERIEAMFDEDGCECGCGDDCECGEDDDCECGGECDCNHHNLS
ncbi:MAG TPA: DUF1292 domain-containing protein [Oscillospiraceae bacterium]|nr:DUF1292 domain-containing protein [Oscillospiraceae bacterium]